MTVLGKTRIAAVEPPVTRARASDARQAFDVLTRAFAGDPPSRWMYPDDEQYMRFFPRFAKVFGGAAITDGTALLSGSAAGAALWLSPDAAPDEGALMALVEASVAPHRRDETFALFEEMGRRHPDEAHWYLPLIGVDPAAQGRGYGSALLTYGLELCDRDDLPAYLEATSARSVPLYERHGFKVVGEIRVGSCPPIVPMLRPARNGGR
jgi:ribosomal protein S18 acetylase RimI-like enzyme